MTAATVAPPVPQHQVALAKANRIRLQRCELKRRIGALPREEGARRVANLIVEPDELVENMRVAELIQAIHRYGQLYTDRTLRRAKVTPLATVGRLTERQRLALHFQLEV